MTDRCSYRGFSKQNIKSLHGPSIVFNLLCYHSDLHVLEDTNELKVAGNDHENLDHLARRCEHVIYEIFASLVDFNL